MRSQPRMLKHTVLNNNISENDFLRCFLKLARPGTNECSLLQLILLGTTQFLASTAITILVQHVHTLMSSKV